MQFYVDQKISQIGCFIGHGGGVSLIGFAGWLHWLVWWFGRLINCYFFIALPSLDCHVGHAVSLQKWIIIFSKHQMAMDDAMKKNIGGLIGLDDIPWLLLEHTYLCLVMMTACYDMSWQMLSEVFFFLESQVDSVSMGPSTEQWGGIQMVWDAIKVEVRKSLNWYCWTRAGGWGRFTKTFFRILWRHICISSYFFSAHQIGLFPNHFRFQNFSIGSLLPMLHHFTTNLRSQILLQIMMMIFEWYWVDKMS